MIRFRSLLVVLLGACAAAPVFAAPKLTTVAERSGFVRTGRYDEVIALCPAFEQAYPGAVRCFEFGRSPEGRPMLALAVSRSGALTPEAAREKHLPVMLAQGGIHSGEIDGKDAGFLALREMLDGKAAKGALDKIVLVFVPVFSVDAHERFKRWNRPNQRGPEEMGWRTTAQGYNLNRDYVKADATEMQHMLRLIGAWDPIVYVDLHATDGAQFEHDIAVLVEPRYSGDAGLRAHGQALSDALMARLARQGSLPLSFYPSFVVNDDPASGFEAGVPTPRFSTGYIFLRNRLGVLVETHSWRRYAERVRSTRNTVVNLVELTAERGGEWLAAAARADADAGALAGTVFPVEYKARGEGHLIDFRGYAYTRTPSEVSGALMTRYDERKRQVWKIPLRDDVQPSREVTVPAAGYIVPAAHAEAIAAHLALHGIEYRRIEQPRAGTALKVFRAESRSFDTAPNENHMRLTVQGEWRPETRDVPAGSLFVPVAQAKARLVISLFDPQAPDSYAAWGRFNQHFSRHEYMEDYVAEAAARQMLKDDPAIATEFHHRLATDPAFAQSPAARLEFFYRRHPSWDDRYNLYPVFQADSPP